MMEWSFHRDEIKLMKMREFRCTLWRVLCRGEWPCRIVSAGGERCGLTMPEPSPGQPSSLSNSISVLRKSPAASFTFFSFFLFAVRKNFKWWLKVKASHTSRYSYCLLRSVSDVQVFLPAIRAATHQLWLKPTNTTHTCTPLVPCKWMGAERRGNMSPSPWQHAHLSALLMFSSMSDLQRLWPYLLLQPRGEISMECSVDTHTICVCVFFVCLFLFVNTQFRRRGMQCTLLLPRR